MSKDRVVVKQGGIGFFSLLCLIFVVLKLAGVTEVAQWSWWWVLAPLWGPTAVVVAFMCLVFVFVALFNRWKNK